jgi:hypothetical protein
MQTISSQEQLNSIEHRLQRVTELLALLIGKSAQQEGEERDEIPKNILKRP